ncbi:hypothetical protein NXZ84_00595 [Mechercharimyces sp. CAU 1602]|nr:hypothetical protein [Mechercharimyces sp. CAU 1602]
MEPSSRKLIKDEVVGIGGGWNRGDRGFTVNEEVVEMNNEDKNYVKDGDLCYHFQDPT